MALWIVKSAVQRIISLCPRSERVNEVFQRYVTGGLRIRPDREFRAKLVSCRRHLENYRSWSTNSKSDFTALELGTGWFPIIPIGLYLCGATQIWTFDIVPLLRSESLRTIVEYFALFHSTGELAEILPEVRQDRFRNLMRAARAAGSPLPGAFLEGLNIHYRVEDFFGARLDTDHVDLIFSHGVLEHLHRGVLTRVFSRFRDLASTESVMSHYIGIADQFAAFDRSITPFNYMRYSDRAWRVLNSPLIPMNRLKACDYRSICREARFTIEAEDLIPGSEEELDSLKLAGEFSKYSREDLITLYYWLVARSSGM